ncbi:MAG: RND transporter [Phycisphaerales bacterium]|jgi:hypothetical protein|nr:RND transporter [Phycisphaerales bacterium]
MKCKSVIPGVVALVAAVGLSGCEKKSEPAAKPAAADNQTTAAADWCAEHGVPESICTRCNPKLIAEFKQKGDWCKEHSLPESQCLECNPDLKEKFEAMKPKGK